MNLTNIKKQFTTGIEEWKFLLAWLIRENNNALVLQTDNTRINNQCLTIQESINFITSNPNDTVWLLNYLISPPTVCIKIDNLSIAERIIEVFQGKFSAYIEFVSILKRPIIIFNASSSSLFLIYKMPSFLSLHNTIFRSNPGINFKKTCRLGIPVEYIFGKIPFVNTNNVILSDPGKIDNLGFLPHILYPWNPTLNIKVNSNYESNLNSNRLKGFTIKDNQSLISSGKNKNLGKTLGDNMIGRKPTLFDWCCIENYNLVEARAIYIFSCQDDLDCRKFVDNTLVYQKEKYSKSKEKNRYFYWFCQYEYSGKTNHSQELHSFAIIKPPSKTKTFKINKPLQNENKILNDSEFLENQETRSNYTLKNHNSSSSLFLETYRIPSWSVYPNISYSHLLEKGIISNQDIANRLHSLQFHPFRVYKAVQNYNTDLKVIILVAILENNDNSCLDDQIWLGRGIENILLWLLDKNHFLNIICVKQKYWFIKDTNTNNWKNATLNEILNLLYYGLYELQIGDFSEILNSPNFCQALIQKVNSDIWPFKLDS